MDDRPLILVSNDDGHSSEGLCALVEAVEKLGEVVVVAPEQEPGAAAAGMGASIFGVPAIAFSRAGRHGFEFGPAARFARSLVAAALGRPLPPRLLLNVNIPPGVEPDGYVVTRLGKHSYGADVVEKKDPRGRSYFWIGGGEYQHEDIPGSDCNAVLREKRVSVTPLMLDLTDEPRRAVVASWTVEGFDRHGG